MPWIKVIDENGAEGRLKEIYERIRKERGKVSNIMRIQSLHPEAMAAHMDLYLSVMFGDSGLSREEREMIATVVSVVNGCAYCTNHHAEALDHYWKDEKKLDAFLRDFESAGLPERSSSIFRYAVKLTETPSKMTQEDIETLRNSGLSDKDILDIDLIVGYFNFVNRIANGLGVEFSPEEVRGYNV
jgi:uncharacterized peroxidase-related enzyme